jgi:hypothetical protein
VEKAGLLTRKINPHDRRSLHISLTPAGQQALRWAQDTYDAAIREALNELPDVSIEQTTALLSVLSRALAARARSEAGRKGGADIPSAMDVAYRDSGERGPRAR